MREFQEKFKTYEDKFPQCTAPFLHFFLSPAFYTDTLFLIRLGSEQSNGMHQYVLWCALEAEGLGVNLQHYNPLIDTRLETMYDVPPTWGLKSQMVFGKPTGQAKEKTFKPVEERVKYFGA